MAQNQNAEPQENILSRRDFLKKTGLSAASIAVAGTALSMLSGCEKAYATTYAPKQDLAYQYAEAKGQDAAPYPFPYQKLDPTTCAERAYAGYQQKGG